jgi:hypothetical protein
MVLVMAAIVALPITKRIHATQNVTSRVAELIYLAAFLIYRLLFFS